MLFLYSVYYELTACTCFEHYLLIFRRRCINNCWYIACVLCRLAATRVGVEVPLDTKSAFCWFYYTDILRCTVNKTLSLAIFSLSQFLIIVIIY
jgi:hypothetical protein